MIMSMRMMTLMAMLIAMITMMIMMTIMKIMMAMMTTMMIICSKSAAAGDELFASSATFLLCPGVKTRGLV